MTSVSARNFQNLNIAQTALTAHKPIAILFQKFKTVLILRICKRKRQKCDRGRQDSETRVRNFGWRKRQKFRSAGTMNARRQWKSIRCVCSREGRSVRLSGTEPSYKTIGALRIIRATSKFYTRSGPIRAYFGVLLVQTRRDAARLRAGECCNDVTVIGSD